MVSVAIVGNGNVGFHLHKKFSEIDSIVVTMANSRKLDSLSQFDVAIIAVSDDAIPEVSSKIKTPLVVHTSGTVSINELQNTTEKGVFYPLQSFSKQKSVEFATIPFCLEAQESKGLELLEHLVTLLGSKYYHLNSLQRKNIHVAAVFANNFTNHLYQISKDICDVHNIPFDILKPLIKETANKITTLSPNEAQTGPAIRDDKETIKNHLHLLNSDDEELYKMLTDSIQKNGKKL